MSPIAFITTCKGRLHHIQQTLPCIVAEAPAQIILVDYGCPDNTADWVEQHYPQVEVVRVTDDPGFCLPRARNLGAARAKTPWLCFIDADVQVRPGWLNWMSESLRKQHFYLASSSGDRQLDEVAGTFICPRSAFDTIGGYDEAFRGWGGEDTDIYVRLAELEQLSLDHYPNTFVSPITHDNTQRTTFHAIKDVRIQGLINRCYVKAKQHLRSLGIAELPLSSRRRLLTRISDQLKHLDRPPKTFAVHLKPEDLLNGDGQTLGLGLLISKRRRYGLFGTRKTLVKTVAPQAYGRLQQWLERRT